MADPYQLIFYLLALGFQLHLIGKRLPPATTADAEMLAERLQTVFRRLYNALDKAFHVVFLFLVNLDVDDVSGNGEIDENHHTVHVCKGFSFGRDGFDGDIFQQEIYSFLGHFSLSRMLCKT